MSDDKKQLGRVQLRRGDDVDPQAEVEALRKLSEQYGVPGIDLTQICVRLDDLELLPREIAERRLILPVLVRDDRVFVAMTNPGDEKLIDELEFVTGKRVFPYVALPTTLERVIAAAYDGKARNEKFYVGPRCPPEIQRKMGVVAEPAQEQLVPPEADSSVFPDAPAPRVAGHSIAEAAERDELSYNELGNTNRDLSVVTEVPAPSPSTPPLSPSKKKTILVVDDEADIRKILQRVLGSKGYKVLEADRGLEALRMVKAHMPDLLLLDAMLPEVHGFEIARRIKGSQKYGHIPIIMVSAVYKGEQYAIDARASYGVDAYIEKPFRIAEIVEAVDAALAGGRTTATAAAPPPPVRRDPDEVSAEAEACLNAGVAAWQAGQLDVAIKHLKRGVELDPLAFRLHFHLGLLYGKKGMVYEAIAELEAAAAQNDKHFPALKNLAVLYQKAGFKTKAMTAWEKASQVAPDEGTRATIRGHIETLR